MIIYVYTTDTYKSKNWYKIGQTSRTAEERIDEQDSTSNPEPLLMITSFNVPDHVTDKAVRDNLIKAGYPQVRDRREWIEIDVDPVSPVWEAIATIPVPQNISISSINKKIAISTKFSEYFGETKAGLIKHGTGIEKCNDGSIYEGIWVNDRFTDGVVSYSNGCTYTGTFKVSQNTSGNVHNNGYTTLANSTTNKVIDGAFEYDINEYIKVIGYQELFKSDIAGQWKTFTKAPDKKIVEKTLISMKHNNAYLRSILEKNLSEYSNFKNYEQTLIEYETFVQTEESKLQKNKEEKNAFWVVSVLITFVICMLSYGYIDRIHQEKAKQIKIAQDIEFNRQYAETMRIKKEKAQHQEEQRLLDDKIKKEEQLAREKLEQEIRDHGPVKLSDWRWTNVGKTTAGDNYHVSWDNIRDIRDRASGPHVKKEFWVLVSNTIYKAIVNCFEKSYNSIGYSTYSIPGNYIGYNQTLNNNIWLKINDNTVQGNIAALVCNKK